MEMKLEDIKTVLILGAGTLGLRVGLQAAISGFDTVIYEINAKAVDHAIKVQDKILKGKVSKGELTESQAVATKTRITFTDNAELAAQDADFVNESVTEDLELKKKVWAQFGELCPPHTVFTTNTSYLLPSQFAADTGRPERFCAFHFHDVFWANVVDIMPHPATAPWMVDLLTDLGWKLQQTPVIVQKESPGYIFNAMLIALIGAAGALVTGEVADFRDVDRSWMGNFKMEMGPFGILDTVGLDTAWHILKGRSDSKSTRFAALLKTYLDAGKLGLKSGEGFYTYPNPEFQSPDFVQQTGKNQEP
jgi:3-hydroxybutyryl-CoA dehydrogenase